MLLIHFTALVLQTKLRRKLPKQIIYKCTNDTHLTNILNLVLSHLISSYFSSVVVYMKRHWTSIIHSFVGDFFFFHVMLYVVFVYTNLQQKSIPDILYPLRYFVFLKTDVSTRGQIHFIHNQFQICKIRIIHFNGKYSIDP